MPPTSRRIPWPAAHLDGSAATVFLTLLIACGGAPRSPEPRATGPRGTPEAQESPEPVAPHASARELLGVTGPDQPWAQMPIQDREMYMIGKVLPILAEIFAEAGREPGHALTCETCHGPRPQVRDFVMPSPTLSPVPRPGTPAYGALREREPAAVAFMEEQVTPTMATLLGMTAGPDGFGCADCHRNP